MKLFKSLFVVAISSTFLLTGCGGDSDNTENDTETEESIYGGVFTMPVHVFQLITCKN